MKIYNETKTVILQNVDLEKGYLKEDKIVLRVVPYQPEIKEQFHYEYKEYKNEKGVVYGRDKIKVVDVPYQPSIEAHEEIESIQVYIPYTLEELEKNKKKKYENTVEKYIREKYSLNEELAILRQRETKTQEFDEYFSYAEQCKARAKTEM